VASGGPLSDLSALVFRTRTATASAIWRASSSGWPYLSELGVDALWLSPIFASPMADFGYDISGLYGDRSAVRQHVRLRCAAVGAHTRGMKVLLDFVPNHSSTGTVVHRKLQFARERQTRLDTSGRDGAPGGGPPKTGCRQFGGSAWAFDAASSQYYYHAFLSRSRT